MFLPTYRIVVEGAELAVWCDQFWLWEEDLKEGPRLGGELMYSDRMKTPANLIDPLRASSSGQEPDGTDENEADGPHEVEIEPTSREHFQTEPTIDKEGNCAAGSHHRERVRK